MAKASGAHRTAGVLAALPSEEWRVVHDVRWPGRPYAGIDHVVVGPGGVFVIDSQCWTGALCVAGGVLRQDGCRRERTVSSAADAAHAVSDLVPETGSVTPVLCFVRDERVLGLSEGVVVCSTVNLLVFLRSRPRVLDVEEVHALADRFSARPERAVRSPRDSATRLAGEP